MSRHTEPRVTRLARVLAVTLALTLGGRGLAYIGPAAPSGVSGPLSSLEGLLPLPVWSLLCFTIALTVLAGVLVSRHAYTIGLTACCAINGAWVGAYITGWAFGYADRAWITGLGYCPEVVAALILLFIGPPRPLTRKRE